MLAFPTNALLHEVSASLGNAPHQIRTGVMGVPDTAEGPACKKRAVALRVLNAGGNVHRELCARCEYRETCPARAGAARGEGSLVLTNHALLPSVLEEFENRTPLVVFDESPQWTEQASVTWADLSAARDRLLLDHKPDFSTPIVERIQRSPVYGRLHNDAVLCLLDLLLLSRTMRPVPDAADAVIRRWGSVRANVARVRSILLGLGVRAGEGVLEGWELDAALSKTGGDPNGIPFDELEDAEADARTRIWAVVNATRAALLPKARLTLTREGVSIAAPSRNAEILARGAVVLDATAGVKTLDAVTDGGLDVVSVALEPSGSVKRRWVRRSGLSRTGVGLRGREAREDVLGAVVDEIRAVAGGEDVKMVVFTYRAFFDDLRRRLDSPNVELHHFGDSRGYNHWFENGFTHYVTVGDPIPNLDASDRVAALWGLDAEDVAAEVARGELTQAHGRARDPRPATVARTHIHFGSMCPYEWGLETEIDVVEGA